MFTVLEINIIIPTSQIRKLNLREFAWVHAADKKQKTELKFGLLTLNFWNPWPQNSMFFLN